MWKLRLWKSKFLLKGIKPKVIEDLDLVTFHLLSLLKENSKKRDEDFKDVLRRCLRNSEWSVGWPHRWGMWVGRRLMPAFPFSQHPSHPSAPYLSVGIHWTSTHWGEKEVFHRQKVGKSMNQKARGQQPKEGHPDCIWKPSITSTTAGTNTMLTGTQHAGWWGASNVTLTKGFL